MEGLVPGTIPSVASAAMCSLSLERAAVHAPEPSRLPLGCLCPPPAPVHTDMLQLRAAACRARWPAWALSFSSTSKGGKSIEVDAFTAQNQDKTERELFELIQKNAPGSNAAAGKAAGTQAEGDSGEEEDKEVGGGSRVPYMLYGIVNSDMTAILPQVLVSYSSTYRTRAPKAIGFSQK